jgi:hypothetical protein
MDEKVAVRIDHSPVRCPYCHGDVLTDQEVWIACAACLARHHADCWSETKRCASCGHASSLAPSDSRIPMARPYTAPRENAYGGTGWVGLKLAAATGLGLLTFAMLGAHNNSSAAYFIIPAAVVAFVLIVTPKPRTGIGALFKGITFALALASVLFGEGTICILMASPLIYGVVGFTYVAATGFTRLRDGEGPTARCVLILPILVASLEGTSERLSFDRDESVTVERAVAAPLDRVEAALAATPRFDRSLPWFLALGFPRPVAARGSGLSLGDERTVVFTGGDGRTHELSWVIDVREPGHVRFRAVSDGTDIGRWLRWRTADVTLAEEAGGTRVRWTLRFERRLDPAWYFGPCERHGVAEAASYLIEALATPRATE